MLSKETKKKIDDARDILVGQLPLPSDQVELITIALIYKFMDDQDEDLRQLEFAEAFFTDELKEYSWQRLMSNEIDAEARVNSFIKGIEEIQKAAHIPLLFREIFKNTFLKFRDGRTLHLFLKVINGFSYDHSEELGNAFEYLLMSMGAQGENDQFRTPRNIIDFIVEVVDPDKGHTVLDPACGTGGFLLSAYKHILRKHTTGCEHYRITLSNEEIEGIPVNWGDKLTSQDLLQLGTSIEGYDITPLMVRLARVNLFLHQFKRPRVHEYDTLTADGRWKDKYDCILANPPFMTPKGGVTTHSRFRIRATKAEVLFSDYILEHLTPDGMAGFIVPEGIIFQNSGDYVELRKWLVTGAGLWAVVSLPAQIFQSYSGVKTSILFIDRNVARSREEIILVKVENDGYSLNTNRAPVSKNDLPEALNLLTIGKKSLTDLREYLEQNSGKLNMPQVLIKSRKEFAKLDAYKAQSSAFNLIRKQFEKCLALEREIKAKITPTPPNLPLTGEELKASHSPSLVKGRAGEGLRVRLQTTFTKQTGDFFKVVGVKYERLTVPIQEYFDTNLKEAVIAFGADNAEVGGLQAKLREHLEGEREYSLGFDRYQTTTVEIDTAYELKEIGELCELINGRAFKPTDWETQDSGGLPIIRIQNLNNENAEFNYYTGKVDDKHIVQKNDLLFSWSGSRGTSFGAHIWKCDKAVLNKHIFRVVHNELVTKEFFYHILNRAVETIEQNLHGGVGLVHITKGNLEEILVPVPPLEIQKQIVTEIEAYQKVVDGCNLIIENYKPDFQIDPKWSLMELGGLCENLDSKRVPITKGVRKEGKYPYYGASGIVDYVESYLFDEELLLISEDGANLLARSTPIAFSVSGKIWVNNHAHVLRFSEMATQKFIEFYINSISIDNYVTGAAQPKLNQQALNSIKIPLPPLETQQEIVAELEQDLAAVAGAKRLKAKMAANIRAVIGRVWGEKA